MIISNSCDINFDNDRLININPSCNLDPTNYCRAWV